MVAGGVGEGDSYGGYREPPGRDAPAEGHPRPRGAARRRHGAAAPVRARERAAPGVRRRGPADRRRPDDLAAVGAGPLPRAGRRSAAASACSRSARGRAIRRRCSRCWPTGVRVERIAGAGPERARRARGRRHPERDGAGGRRHARLAAVRAVRRDPGGRRVAGDPGAAGGAARARAGGWSSRSAIATTRS